MTINNIVAVKPVEKKGRLKKMLKGTHIHTSLAIVGAGIVFQGSDLQIANPAFDIPLLVGTVIGATIPDIDHKSTSINRMFGNFGKKFADLIGHRTWTHTLWAILAWFVIAFFSQGLIHFGGLYTPHLLLGNPLVVMIWGIAIGNLLHILEDNCSIQGVLFLYPFTHYETSKNNHPYKKRKWSNARYRTGSGAENAINIVMTIAFLAELWVMWHIWYIH